MAKKLETYNRKMILLIEILKTLGKIESNKQFFEIIKISKQNYGPIKKGIMSFTIKQIETACLHFEVNFNWIFGIEKNMFLD